MSEQAIIKNEEPRKINPSIWGKLRKKAGEKEYAHIRTFGDYDDQVKYLSNFFPPEKIFLPAKENSAIGK